MNGKAGNPPVQFLTSVTEPSTSIVSLVETGVARPVETGISLGEKGNIDQLILLADLQDAECTNIAAPSQGSDPTFGWYNGAYWLHDPRLVRIIFHDSSDCNLHLSQLLSHFYASRK